MSNVGYNPGTWRFNPQTSQWALYGPKGNLLNYGPSTNPNWKPTADPRAGTTVEPYSATSPTTPPPVSPTTPPPIPGGGPIPPDQYGQLSNPQTPVNVGTPTTDISPYIPGISNQQQDIVNQAITQSQNVGAQNVQSLQDIMGPYVQSQMKNWTDPNSPDYQSTMGQLNNYGRADPNTFGQSLSSRLAPLIGQNMMSLGTNALIPSFQKQQDLVGSGAGVQSNLGLASLQRFINQQDWTQNAGLANQLADKGQPSSAQQGVGMGSSILNGLGNFGQGFGGLMDAGKATSYVCMELIKRGLLCESDMDDFHAHIMPAMFKKGRAFWKYAMDGWRLVEAANHVGVDWTKFKPLLFDRVMKEKDPCAAVDLYAEACYELCCASDWSLWDPRVYRTSFWDSLIFLPRLFLYKPFREALWKCVRIKTLFLYDKPRCGAHL